MTGQYKLQDTSGVWTVYERGYPLGKSKSKQTARKFYNHLKYGGAFEGRTPDFILKSGAVDLDRKYEEK